MLLPGNEQQTTIGIWCNWQHYGFWYRHSRFESWYPSQSITPGNRLIAGGFWGYVAKRVDTAGRVTLVLPILGVARALR